uniref:Uncharacterized protein n=1 Tax=Nelumbo nucifera TaxID=4432 RepID=A0A822ZTG3_NELNU|nr:TPA_asm: hypothetical protein HUJ06_016768 [Nelumbo nucifera]
MNMPQCIFNLRIKQTTHCGHINVPQIIEVIASSNLF